MEIRTKFVEPIVDPTKVVYDTCDGQTMFYAFMYKGERWWRLCSPSHPDRYFKLYSDESLKRLVDNYGFLDAMGCVNRGTGVAHSIIPQEVRSVPLLDSLSPQMRSTTGVPQRVKNSGLCWYCAVCFVLFFSRQMRELVFSRAPDALKALCKAPLHDKAEAERLRQYLYHTYAFGDRPGQPPQDDGQNGFTQMCILMHHLDIPMIRLFAPSMYELTDDVIDQQNRSLKLRRDPAPNETSLLTVRCFRTKWRAHRRIVHKGRRYKLVALLIGSEYCGHQIAASSCDMRVCRWALSDSDMSQHGIGPIFWSIKQQKDETRAAFKKRWLQMWDTMVPVTILGGSQVCDLNPVNRAPHELEKYAMTLNEHTKPGVVNTDYIYMSEI